MVWSEAIQLMLATHAKWRTLTQRPFPPAGSCGMMLSLAWPALWMDPAAMSVGTR